MKILSDEWTQHLTRVMRKQTLRSVFSWHTSFDRDSLRNIPAQAKDLRSYFDLEIGTSQVKDVLSHLLILQHLFNIAAIRSTSSISHSDRLY